jgi:dihydropteroate synthase
LGVINLTPNSFSDGGIHLDQSKLLSTLNHFLSIENLIIDIGFESTAPMNQAITGDEEKKRFDNFLLFLKQHHELPLKKLSIDTYRPENFVYFYQEIKKLFPEIKIMMNDVSGVLDEGLANMLSELADVDYIFTCTRIPDRTVVLDHMSFLQDREDNIVDECFMRFSKAHQWFTERNLLARVFFDPGFGFSKSYTENWNLINGFSQLVSFLDKKDMTRPWVIGISKKSFLRKKCEQSANNQALQSAVEELHQTLLRQFLKQTKSDIIFRVHDPVTAINIM